LKPVSIDNMGFVDATFGAESVERVEEETTETWCSETGSIEPLVEEVFKLAAKVVL
jgi:hypothetical protein